MSQYLTKRVRTRPSAFQTLIILWCLFVIALMTACGITLLIEDDSTAVSIFSFGIVAIHIIPLVAICRKLNRSKLAARCATVFDHTPEAVLPLAQLNRQLGKTVTMQDLQLLVVHNYLQNIYPNNATNAVEFLTASPLVDEAKIVPMNCPGCGGSVTAVRSRVTYCRFCGKALVPPEE